MKRMATKKTETLLISRLLAWVLTVFCIAAGNAEPFRLTPEGEVGNINDGLGMPVDKLRSQLDAYWEKGDRNTFFRGGAMLCEGLAGMKDEASVKLYVETCLHILGHRSTPPQDPYGIVSLVRKKGEIVRMMLAGDYLGFVSAGEYRKTRKTVMDAGIVLMNDLRTELKATPPTMPELDSEWQKGHMTDEKRKALVARAKERGQQRLAVSAELITREDLPKVLGRIESNFVKFADQEYRRVPPEKGEMEKIIERAALPEEATARLKVLIPP